MKPSWKKFGLGAVGAGAAIALVVGGMSLFGGSKSAQASPNDPTAVQHALQLLANNLGVSVDKLNQAFTDTRNQLVDEAVAAGKLTADQASKIKSQPVGNTFAGLLGRLDKRDDLRHIGQASIVQSAAKTIGIDVATVRSELQQGKSLAAIGSEHGKSRDDLKNGILSIEKGNLQTLVSNGKLTQTQADNAYQALSNNIDKILDATHTPGQHPGPMGPRHRNGQTAPTPTP